MPKARISQQRLLTLTVIAALLLAFLPARYTAWVDALQGPVDFFFAPVSHLASYVSRTLRPAVSGTLPSDADLARIAIERDKLQTELLDADRRIEELKRLVRDLQGGINLAPDVEVRALAASVIGASSDLADGLLTVRAGRDEGVTERETVAVVNGVHLVGRVESVAARTSRVRPITRSGAGWIQALVYIDRPGGKAYRCQLRGADDGTLKGDLEEGAQGIEPGQEVRLQDADWPDTAQMLVLGRVESVGAKEGAPLRSVIIVRPDLQLERVRRVVLRIPAAPAGEIGGTH